MSIVPITENLVDTVWGSDKPARPAEKVFILDIKYSGVSIQDKFKKVSDKLRKKVDVLLVTTLDDIAWLLNLRGNDIKFNPIFFSYLLFHVSPNEEELSKVSLFINKDKVSDENVSAYLHEGNV